MGICIYIYDRSVLYVREVCDTMSDVDSDTHEVSCTEICGVSPTKNHREKDPCGAKHSEENKKRFSVRTTCVRWGSRSLSYSPEGSRAAYRRGEGPCRVPNYHMILQSLPNGL